MNMYSVACNNSFNATTNIRNIEAQTEIEAIKLYFADHSPTLAATQKCKNLVEVNEVLKGFALWLSIVKRNKSYVVAYCDFDTGMRMEQVEAESDIEAVLQFFSDPKDQHILKELKKCVTLVDVKEVCDVWQAEISLILVTRSS